MGKFISKAQLSNYQQALSYQRRKNREKESGENSCHESSTSDSEFEVESRKVEEELVPDSKEPPPKLSRFQEKSFVAYDVKK